MNKIRKNDGSEKLSRKYSKQNEKGSAIVIALLIMVLLLGFVALAVTRTTNETVASSNDAAESRTFEAAQASLEIMTSNFDNIFLTKLSPTIADLNKVRSQTPPDFDNYNFEQKVTQTQASEQVVMTGQLFQGLNATRDEWELETTATDPSGVQVALRRKFFNNLIPIFQFGIFYDDDLEFHPGPRFDFGGRVHSNRHIFMQANTGLYFSSKVTATGQVYTDVARNGNSWTNWNENVFIKNADGKYVQLKHNMGSVLNSDTSGQLIVNQPDMPKGYVNSAWATNEGIFQGNLLPSQKRLDLPIYISSVQNNNALDYIELVKRGKSVGDLHNNGTSVVAVSTATADNAITASERYYNKTGIRISLADKKERLPGCATGSGAAVSAACGVRLDGKEDGSGNISGFEARGYKPRAMLDGYQATRLNGERFYTGREVWIKIETVAFDETTLQYVNKDITEDILSLGVTERAPSVFNISGYHNVSTMPDSRSIVKLQRFAFEGVALPDTTYNTSSTLSSVIYNYVLTAKKSTSDSSPVPQDNGEFGSYSYTREIPHWHKAAFGNTDEKWIVPFPINMFDTREGLFYEGTSVFNPTSSSNYSSDKVPWAGVMSMVDIDVANLRKFLKGDFDTVMPQNTPFYLANGNKRLAAADIPQNKGWVLYVSDRRGDSDFDGEYDMEDIYGNNDGILQPGEDSNHNGSLQTDFFSGEGAKYTKDGVATTSSYNSYALKGIAAVFEHKFYRRGVRLINGETLPGIYDSVTPSNTRGFTVASENGVYVQGNYNATGIANVGTPTPSTSYLPQNTSLHIPASIVADSITILSNKWTDSHSFVYPFSLSSRKASETHVRFALIAGDTKTSLSGAPNQGGSDPRMAGGVHNFKRFLEDWGSVRLNYAGSLINLYNSRNNNGAFKCCSIVYSPPTRNWVFDMSFLEIDRLPPGTPFFQTLQLTGFQRLN